MTGSVRKTAFLLLLVLAWAAASSLRLVPAEVLPGPMEVGAKLLALLADGALAPGVLRSLARVAAGYLAAVILGLAVGFLMAGFSLAEEVLGPFTVTMQTLPSVAWFPLMVLWFGSGEGTIVLIIALGGFGSVALATHGGIRNIPPLILRAARTLGAGGRTLALRVILPAAFPSILVGMKMGWAFAWRALIAAELLYAAAGLGATMKDGQARQDVPQVMAALAVIVAVGLLVDRLVFSRLERRLQAEWGSR